MATSDVEIDEVEEKPQINGKKQRNTFLDNFGKLTSNEQKIRLKTGCQIIRHLGKNNDNEKEFQYAIKRLVRGVGASKINTRIAYFTTLCVLLETTHDYDINELIDIISEQLKTSGTNQKSENADCYTGKILAAGAVFHSGRFGDLNNDNKKILLQNLVEASTKKSYLGLLGTTFIVDQLPKLDVTTFSNVVLPVLRPQLHKQISEYSIDQLYLLLKCEDHFAETITTKFLCNLIDCDQIIKGNIKHILHVLLDVHQTTYGASHPIYPYIAQKFASSKYLPQILKEINTNLERFTHIKLELIAIILSNLVDNLKDSDQHQHVPLVFGKNVLIESLRHFKTTTIKQQDGIKTALVNLLNSTAAWSKNPDISSDIKIAVMETLMFYPGVFIFEKTTGNKVLQSITSTLDVVGCKKLCDIYKGVMCGRLEKKINDCNNIGTWLNLDRVYAAQLIVKLINHQVMRNESEQEWRIEQLIGLMQAGLLKQHDVGGELHKCLKDNFFSALNFKFGKLQDVITCLSRLVEALNDKLPELKTPLDPEVHELWVKTLEIVDKIKSKDKSKNVTAVFHTLFLHMALQLFNDAKLATDSLNELFSCYAKRKSKFTNDEVYWVEVVVDLFLNLLSHNSQLLRSIINKVFPHLCKHLTTSGIHQILHVLDPKSDDNPLSFNHDEDSDDDNDNDEDSDDNSDDSNESDEDEEESEDNEEFDEKQNDKLRLALHDVLLKNSQTNENDDNESIDLDDMSDTEADKLNSALGEAFKKFRPNLKKNSKKQSKDEETLTHFRVRVMDLIDIYLDSPDVTLTNCLEIMMPLLQSLEFTIRDSHQKPFYDRIKSSLKKLTSKRFSAELCQDVDESVLLDCLKNILDKGTKSTLVVQEMSDRTADCCMMIINVSSNIESCKQMSAYVIEILDLYFKKRDCLTPYVLFKNILSSVWEQCWVMIGPLTSYVFDDDIRPFRKKQALELLRIFYLNNRLVAAHKDLFGKKLKKVEMKFNSFVSEFLEQKEYKSSGTFLNGLFLLLAAIKNCCHQSDQFDWVKIAELVRDYRSGITLTNDGKQAFNKLCNALKVSNVVKMQSTTVKLSMLNKIDKDENDDDEDNDDNEEVVVEKKKGNKTAKKMKKEARNLRMASLSEGLSKKFNFSEANVEEMDVEDAQDEENNKLNGCEDNDDVSQEILTNGVKNKNQDKKKSKKRVAIEETVEDLPKQKKKKQKSK